MANLEGEDKAVFYEIMINYFMNNPLLYDKGEERYSFTVDKLDKLMILSNYLKELNIHMSVPQIVKAWQELVKEFKAHAAGLNKVGSGSAAVQDNAFPYYEHLLFLKPSLQHRPVVSTLTLSQKEHLPTANSHDDPDQNQISYSPLYVSPHSTDVADVSYKPLDTQSCSLSAKTSTASKTKNVPELDNFAKKKLKLINETDETIHIIGKKIIETLDDVNSKVKGNKESTINQSSYKTISQSVDSIDYKKHLTLAVSKIPSGYEDECMEYIIQELEKFDEQQN